MNPMQLMNMFKQAQNPFVFMQQITKNNPQAQQIINSLQGKSPKELEEYARNMAQSGNINLNEFMSRFGVNIQ